MYINRTNVSNYFKANPQLGLSVALFLVGAVTVCFASAFGGALFGAGASLLGTWITKQHDRSVAEDEKRRRHVEARQYLAPELCRTIERALYIHERAIPNFICASAENDLKPNDLKDDFIPYWPVLYPTAPQFSDLSGDEAVALVSFYDSLHSLGEVVSNWWGREGQLPVNIFNSILHHAGESLILARVCAEKFELGRMFPEKFSSVGTVTSRIERSIAAAASARDQHIKRFEDKAANTAVRAGPSL